MKKIYSIILGLLIACVLHLPAFAQIRILLSAALTDAHYEFRKQQYIESISILAQYGHNDVYIVEALKQHGPTFLDYYSKNVFYSSANNPNLDHRNFGINEAKTLLEGLYHFNFDPEDIIIKMTGRYQLISNYFLELVKNNPNFDAYIKFNANGTTHTLAFAMKSKHLQEMLETMDYAKMEQTFATIEEQLQHYITRKQKEGTFKVYPVDKLDIRANLFGSSTLPSIGHITRIY